MAVFEKRQLNMIKRNFMAVLSSKRTNCDQPSDLTGYIIQIHIVGYIANKI